MADNRQKEKIRDDIYSENEEHADPNVGKEPRNEGTKDPNPGKKDAGIEDNILKKGSRDKYYNESNLQV
ncbi:hypothetical protein ACSBR2_012497 [Camellia fascicularis]